MSAFIILMNVLSGPLMLLNALGGLAGIWLAFLGEWRIIGWGILGLFVAGYALRFALVPGGVLTALASSFSRQKQPWRSYVLIALGRGDDAALISAWCCAVLYFLVWWTKPMSLIPTLLWSYSTAMSPIAYFVSKARHAQDFGECFGLIFFVAQLGYAVAMLLIGAVGQTVAVVLMIYGFMMLVGFAFQATVAIMVRRERQAA